MIARLVANIHVVSFGPSCAFSTVLSRSHTFEWIIHSPAKRWATRSAARCARATARLCSSTRRTSACDDSRRTVWPGRRTRSWTRPTSGRLEADFLLLAPRELARLRDARGKPPLKIPPVSATMPGVAARGYFGQRCVAAKFPGRAFPAEPYFVEHALALTRHVVRAGADWH